MKRAQLLKNEIYGKELSLCADRAYWLTISYQETEGEPMIIRRAKAFKKVLQNMQIYILDNELIVGNLASSPRSAPIFPDFGVEWLEREIDDLPHRDLEAFLVPDEVKAWLRDMAPYWKGKTHEDYARNLLKEILPGEYVDVFQWEGYNFNHAITCASHMSTGDGHIIVNYNSVLQNGLKKTIETAKEKIASMPITETDVDKKLFYKATIVCAEGLIEFAHRYADEAERIMGARDIDAKRAAELKKIADVCRRVPEHPARDLHEALQVYWFVYLAMLIESNGHGISFGRFDQYLYPYYVSDMKNGLVTRDDAVELTECFLMKCNDIIKVREWGYTAFMTGFLMGDTLTVGGIDRMGNDAVNDMSYITLEATANNQMPKPTTVVRINEKTSDEFLMFSANALVRHNGGLPAFFSDVPAMSILQNMGVSVEDSRDWAIVGCCEPSVPGKFMTCTGGVCQHNILKVMEIALNNGRDPANGITLLPGKGDLETFKSADEIVDAFKEQLAFYMQFTPLMDNVTCKTYESLTPTPFASMLIDGRMESAVDITVKDDGYSIHHICTQGHGTVNAGNCLEAIKKVIFDDRLITGKQLKDALASDYAGTEGERIRKMMLNAAPKFGNDVLEVDGYVHDVIKSYTDLIRSYKSRRGGFYGPSTQGLTANVPQGAAVGATPDGRKAGTPLADNTSPTAGTDMNGPTAVVTSEARIDHRGVTNGTIFNVKFHPSALQDQPRVKKFCDFIRTYFRLGGSQIQFNIVSREVLLAAKENPEEYDNLIVKVAGYSALFTQLDERLQDQVIERTENVF